MGLSTFQTRLISALIMLPPVVLIVYLGGVFFVGLLIIALAISLYEWVNISKKTSLAAIFILLGIVYLFGSYYLFFRLREIPNVGFYLTVLLFFCIWSSDSFAYAFGKIFKGPKLLPRVSPNKTIAGLIGAVVGVIVILLIAKILFHYVGPLHLERSLSFIFTFGVLIGLIAQAGDLLVSALKRAAKVKDSGNIIPGHGGLLDRIDALLLVSPVFYFVSIYYLVG